MLIITKSFIIIVLIMLIGTAGCINMTMPEIADSDSLPSDISEGVVIENEDTLINKNTITDGSEILSLKFYIKNSYDSMHYVPEESSIDHLLEDSIRLFDWYYHVSVINLWYEGNKIYVDFDSSSINKLAIYYSTWSDIDFMEIFADMCMETLSTYPHVEEIELLIDGEKGCFDNQSVNCTFEFNNSSDWDTACVRFYFASAKDPIDSSAHLLGYKTEQISHAKLLDDTIRYMGLHNGIKIINIWYEKTKLFVDLDFEEFYRMNNGISAGQEITQILVKTFSSYPGVEEIEFLLGGERNFVADHFSFDRVFAVKSL